MNCSGLLLLLAVVLTLPSGVLAQQEAQLPDEEQLEAQADEVLGCWVGRWTAKGELPPEAAEIVGAKDFIFEMSCDWTLEKRFLEAIWKVTIGGLAVDEPPDIQARRAWLAAKRARLHQIEDIAVKGDQDPRYRHLAEEIEKDEQTLERLRDEVGVLHGRSFLGWNPLTRKITEWVFSSDGHSQLVWTISEDGKKWVGQASGFVDGLHTSSTQLRTVVDSDTMKFVYTNQAHGPRILSSDFEMTLKRQKE